MSGFRSTMMPGEVPAWFCMAHPSKCIAEGDERGDKLPDRCPECGSPVGVTIFADETEPPAEGNSK